MANETIQLSHGLDIQYRAFARSFHPGQKPVIYVVATCAYTIDPVTIFFEGTDAVPGLAWKLFEKFPGDVFTLDNFPIASTTTRFAPEDTPRSVTVIDAHGTHSVPVEPWPGE